MVGPLCPRIVCCHEATAAWAVFFFFARKAQLWVPLSRRGRRGRAAVAVSIKVSCRASRGRPGKSPAAAAPGIMSRMLGLAATRASRCGGRATSCALLYPIPDGAECGLFQTFLSKSGKESFERPLPDFIKKFGGFFFVHSEDVVGSTDAKALAKEGKLCLWTLTYLHAMASAF